VLVPTDHEGLAPPASDAEIGVITDARRRQRRRRFGVLLLAVVAIGVYVAIHETAASVPPSGRLLSRPLHLPALGPGGRCPVSSGFTVNNSYFGGSALGSGPVRVLVANRGDVLHGRLKLGTAAARGWFALQTLWFAMRGMTARSSSALDGSESAARLRSSPAQRD
jgi:hypothetical protein